MKIVKNFLLFILVVAAIPALAKNGIDYTDTPVNVMLGGETIDTYPDKSAIGVKKCWST
ncbi:MAG TPA: hypothetical protein VKR58_12045 [Aquella sp.]|nr:hypothetical protein [Aquella sp.]